MRHCAVQIPPSLSLFFSRHFSAHQSMRPYTDIYHASQKLLETSQKLRLASLLSIVLSVGNIDTFALHVQNCICTVNKHLES